MKLRCSCVLLAFPLAAACSGYSQSTAPTPSSLQRAQSRDAQIRELQHEVDSIETRLHALESEDQDSQSGAAATPPSSKTAEPAPAVAVMPKPPVQASAPVVSSRDSAMADLLNGTTFGVGLDGYYGYNFNDPIGGVNLLRAYDVTSNSFNINQADIVVEHMPTTKEPVGGRIDLQFGQAAETLGGSSANEQRPQVWRDLFQAYGSYLAPIGSGLELDFGKWASWLGAEGNYTKDQIAYSRGYMFAYLPSYHMGLRANYNLTPKVNLAYWLVNGANDTEDLNGYKSQAFLFTLKPASSVTWNINYYFGEEGRAVQASLNPGPPTQPGLPTADVTPTPDGREHIFDTYATWNATPKLTLVGEADYVLNRTYAEQQPLRVAIGAFEFKYTLPRNWYIGGRAEYFDDRGGLFSGKTQALKEFTLVANRELAPGFQARMEYRRDFSNQLFFLSSRPGVLESAQPTATLGLIYSWGTKQGGW